MACPLLVRESDSQFQQGAAGALATIISAHGHRQQLSLIGCDPTQGKPYLLFIAQQGEASDTGCDQELSDLLPCPTTLSEGHKGMGMQCAGEIEIEYPERTMGKGCRQSTVRRRPSGKVMFTPRR